MGQRIFTQKYWYYVSYCQCRHFVFGQDSTFRLGPSDQVKLKLSNTHNNTAMLFHNTWASNTGILSLQSSSYFIVKRTGAHFPALYWYVLSCRSLQKSSIWSSIIDLMPKFCTTRQRISIIFGVIKRSCYMHDLNVKYVSFKQSTGEMIKFV